MTAPKLRLAGFKEPWSPKRLGATGRILQERTSDFARYPLYSLTIEKGVTKKTERYERGFLVSKTGDIFKIVHPGNFVTNPMNLRFGAVGYSKEEDDVSVSGYYDVFELDDNKCSPFWFNFLKREEMKKRYEDIATGSLIEKKRVHVNDLLNLELPIPELDERKSVGEYLISLDRLIDAEALRLESFRRLKSSCLGKMFVQGGEKCPRLRLGGFKGDWVTKVLGDCGTWNRGQPLSKSDLGRGRTPCIHYGELFGYGMVIKCVNSATDVVPVETSKGGELLFPDSDVTPLGLARCSALMVKGVLIGGGINILTPKAGFDAECLSYAINVERRQIIMRVTGTTVRHINSGRLSEITIHVPPSVEEQKAIGEVFFAIESIINMQAMRVQRLKNFKLACMERMFV